MTGLSTLSIAIFIPDSLTKTKNTTLEIPITGAYSISSMIIANATTYATR